MTRSISVFKTLSWMLSAGFLLRLVSGLTTISLAYFLPVIDYGQLTTGIFWSLLIILFAGSGLANMFVNRSFSLSHNEKAIHLYHFLILSIFLGLIALWLIYYLVIEAGSTGPGSAFYILCGISAIFTALNNIAQGALRAADKIVVQSQLVMATALLVNVGLFMLAWHKQDIITLGVWYVASFLMLFILHIIVLRFYRMLTISSIRLAFLFLSMRASVPFNLVPILMTLLPVLSSTAMYYSYGLQTVGSYNLVISFYFAATSVSVILDQVFHPLLLKNKSNIGGTATGYLLVCLFISLPALYLFGLYAPQFATSYFPEKYIHFNEMILILAMLIPLRFANHAFSVYLRVNNRQARSIIAYSLAIAVVLITFVLPLKLTKMLFSEFGVSLILLAAELIVFVVIVNGVSATLDKVLLKAGLKQLLYICLSSGLFCALAYFLDFSLIAGVVGTSLVYIGVAIFLEFHVFIKKLCAPV